MKIKLSSIMVENQATALVFYTDVLGFKKSKDIPVGEFRWLTVISPDGYPDLELVLEPNANPVAGLALTGNKDNVVLALIGRPASTECDLRFFSAAAGYLDQVAAGIGKNRKLSIRPFESIFTT